MYERIYRRERRCFPLENAYSSTAEAVPLPLQGKAQPRSARKQRKPNSVISIFTNVFLVLGEWKGSSESLPL